MRFLICQIIIDDVYLMPEMNVGKPGEIPGQFPLL